MQSQTGGYRGRRWGRGHKKADSLGQGLDKDRVRGSEKGEGQGQGHTSKGKGHSDRKGQGILCDGHKADIIHTMFIRQKM